MLCRAQRRPDRARLQVRDRRRQRARAQHHAKVLRLLLVKPPVMRPVSRIALWMVATSRTLFSSTIAIWPVPLLRVGVLVEAVAGLGGQVERDVRAAVLVGRRLRVAEVRAFHDRRALQHLDLVGAARAAEPVHQLFVGRNRAVSAVIAACSSDTAADHRVNLQLRPSTE